MPGAGPDSDFRGPGRAERGPNAGPSQHMNFNFFLKNQFWSYEHAKTFVVTGNMSVSLTETL